jgi:hypothetical protein
LSSGNAEAIRILRRREAEALANAGLGVAAAEAFAEACEGASAAEQLELRRRRAEQLLRCGELRRGVDALREVLAGVDLELWLAPTAALILLVLNHLFLRLRGLGYVRRDASQISSEQLTRVDVCGVVGEALAVVHPIPAKIYQKRHLVWALRAGEPLRIARGLAIEAATESIGGARAIPRVERLLGSAEQIGAQSSDPYLEGWIHAAHSMTRYFRGDFVAAAAEGDRTIAIFSERCAGAHWEVSNMHLFVGWSEFHLGELRALGRRVAGLAHDARQRRDLYLLTNVRIGLLNVVWLAADDPDRAIVEIDAAMRDWGSSDLQVQLYHETVARAHVYLYQRRPEQVLELLDRHFSNFRRAQLFRIQTVHLYALHLRARAALSAHRITRDPRLLSRARADARYIRRSDANWAHPLAALLDAASAIVEGDQARALALLDRAIEDLDSRSMKLWAAAARTRRASLRGERDEAADAAFAEAGVKNPSAFTEMLFPEVGQGDGSSA